MVKTLLITSGKGGAGKTSFTVNFSTMLNIKGIKVAVIDMSHGHRDLDFFIGVQDRIVFDLTDVLTNVIDDSKIKILEDRVDYFPASQNHQKFIENAEKFPEFLENLGKTYNLVIIDVSFDMLICKKNIFENCDFGINLTDYFDASIRSAENVNDMLKSINTKMIFTVINETKKQNEDPEKESKKVRLNHSSSGLIGEIPFFEGFCGLTNNSKIPILENDNIFATYAELADTFIKRIKE